MIAVTASVFGPDHMRRWFFDSTEDINNEVYHNSPNVGVTKAYHTLWEAHKDEDAIIYMHDDVEILDPDWVQKVALELMDPEVAIVGLGGATSIGDKDIYKTPYRIEQLIRHNYSSNQKSWEIHGTHETGTKDVAVVDGFVMAIKGEFLKRIGGWSWFPFAFHCYDIAMCLMAARHGRKVRMVGVECDHHGGGTSTKTEYAEWCKENGTTIEREHYEPHVWVYNEFRDILPLVI